MKKTKRDFLKLGLSGVALGVVHQAQAITCVPKTADQPKGPFYPENDQQDKDNDLTWVRGGKKQAEGEVITISGKVQDADCKDLEGALVEIWQACHTGKYNHSADPNTAELDPDFQYWGRAVTNKKGEYSFKTILPGAYPAGGDWIRPPHIHCKVQKRGYFELITQMYFKNTDHLLTDRLFLSIPAEERESVLLDLKKEEEQEVRSANFNIKIQKI